MGKKIHSEFTRGVASVAYATAVAATKVRASTKAVDNLIGSFSGQTAVITGASGGIGSAIAAQLFVRGAAVVLVGRARDAVEQTIRDHGWPAGSVQCCTADFCEPEGATLARRLCELCSHVHILVHAAGTITQAAIGESELADFDRQYRVNVRTPYELTRVLLPRIVSCGGQVVFINSSVGINAKAGVSQYAATKHALRAVADSLRAEVNAKGVRVTSIFPGRTASGMQAAIHQHEGRAYRPERLLQPDDVANIVVAALQLPRTAEVTDIHIRPMLKS
jgi:NADP-dependent 3-hydroxy acid dehydrogenase YdfG